jgi:hypothetical protein
MPRRLIALACVALIVVVTAAPAVSSHFSDALELLPVWLFPVLALFIRPNPAEPLDEHPVPLLSSLSPRPPPVQPVLV